MENVGIDTLVSLFIAVVVSAVITVIIFWIRTAIVILFRREKLCREAIAEGRIIWAKLVKVCSPSRLVGADEDEVGIYEFQYNGKTYRRKVVMQRCLTEQIDLYYVKNPRKAVTYDNFGTREFGLWKYYLVTLIIVSTIMIIFGVL